MWPEVEKAKSEKRCELVLSGSKINDRLEQSGLDSGIFELSTLNYLNISESTLTCITDDICKLPNLQTLVLCHNKLTAINGKIFELGKLKTLDLSRNNITELPTEVAKLTQLTALNISANAIETVPSLEKNTKLATLNLANNKLIDISNVCHIDLTLLSDLIVSGNALQEIPSTIAHLKALKNLDLSSNKIKSVPGELADCTKLKDVNLKGNPVSDRRLLKLIDQCRTKQIIDYVKQNCPRSAVAVSNEKERKSSGIKDEPAENDNKKYTINVQYCTDDSLKIIVLEEVKSVRGHISACIVKDVQFTEENFKKFIQLQTKLHDSVCQKRNLATIATHDLKKLGEGNLTYTAVPPKQLKIIPLNRTGNVSGAELFSKLQTEAENLRKEKKRNVYSGIHKYLYLIEGQKLFPCLKNSNKDVISFPPLTNSEITKISPDTTSIFIEVTSSTSQQASKHVLNTVLKDMVLLFDKDLTVQQVKNVDNEGNLKMVYPARTDLNYEEDVPIKIARE